MNVLGLNFTKGGNTLTEYIGAKPLSQTGKYINSFKKYMVMTTIILCLLIGFHRLVLLAYQQPSNLTFDEPHLTIR